MFRTERRNVKQGLVYRIKGLRALLPLLNVCLIDTYSIVKKAGHTNLNWVKG